MMTFKASVKKIVFGIPSSMVLMFHHVSDKPESVKSGCMLTTESFKQVIEAVPQFASLKDVIEHPRKRRAAITFDDGLADLYTTAYPILKEKSIPFTAFIVTDFLDTPGYITTKQLLEMSRDPLVTIGSHGISHEIFTKMSSSQKIMELQGSKEKLEKLIHKEVDIFAFSHGQYDKETIKLMEHYRYGMGVCGRPMNFFTKYNLKALPRYNVENDTVNSVLNAMKEVLRG